MRIDLDKAYQVARSTNFISKPIYVYEWFIIIENDAILNKSNSNPYMKVYASYHHNTMHANQHFVSSIS